MSSIVCRLTPAHVAHHRPFLTFALVACQMCPCEQRHFSLTGRGSYVADRHSPPCFLAVACMSEIVSLGF